MQATRLIADRLINLSAIIGSVGLMAEMGIILTDVIGRAAGVPLYGSQDLVTMTMVFVVFSGMAICDRTGGHIAIDVFERFFSNRFNRAIDALSAALGAIIFLAIAWTVYESAKLSIMLNLATNLLDLPKVWFQWALCALAVMTSLGMALRAVELGFSGRDVRHDGLMR
jgi:TRAP-type C4-dicarboxylate transport system permease small subunit